MRVLFQSLVVILFFGIFWQHVLAESPAPWGNLEMGPFPVGFRLFQEHDGSRTFHPEGDTCQRARRVRVYVWYPAQATESDSSMPFETYVKLATEDFDFCTSRQERDREDRFTEIPLFRGLSKEGWDALLNAKTAAVLEAPYHEETFPLIVFGQGLYYESPITHAVLCEYLASHGYVVATCPLVGTHSRLVHLDVVDLETQVRDMEYVLSSTRSLQLVDPNLLGLIGFDLGGMSSLVLAMRNTDVDAFVSLDAGILFGHPSELPNKHPNYDVLQFRVPWMHMTQARAVEANRHLLDDHSLFGKAGYADTYLLWFDDVGHVDFTSYAMYGIAQPVPMYWGPRQGREAAAYQMICRYVVNFFNAYLKDHADGRAFLRKTSEEWRMHGVSFHIMRRQVRPAPPTRDDFINALLDHDIKKATETVRQIRTKQSDADWMQEESLNRLGYTFLYQYQRPEEAIVIFKLNTELYPQSANAYDSLGEAYFQNRQEELAIKHYEKSLELNPENANAREMLKRLSEQ